MIKVRKTLFVISIIGIVMVLSGLLSITYGYINTKISGNELAKKAVFNSEIVKVEYSDGEETLTSSQEYFVPGSTLTKTFTITNTGNVPVKYSINLTNIENEFERSDDLTYELTSNDEILHSGMYETKGVFPKSDTYILSKDVLNIGESKTYTLKVNYLKSEENQIIDQGKVIKAKISIENSIKTIKSLKVYGNSVQDGTPRPETPVEIESLGVQKNMFNIDDFVETYTPYMPNKPTFETFDGKDCLKVYGAITADGRAIEYMKGQFKENTQYTISLMKYDIMTLISAGVYYKGLSMSIYYTDGSYKSIWDIDNKETEKMWQKIKFTSAYGKTIDYIKFSYATGSSYSYIYDWQIEEGTKSTEYINYGKYEIPIKVNNKNMFDFTSLGNMYNSGKSVLYDYEIKNEIIQNKRGILSVGTYFECNINKLLPGTYTLSVDVYQTETLNTTIGFKTPTSYINSKQNLKSLNTWHRISYTFTIKEETEILGIQLQSNGISSNYTNVEAYFKNIQLEVGDTNTEYKLYIPEKSIVLDEPLRKVGNCEACSDYIDFNTGEIIRNVKNIYLDQNNEWSIYSSFPNHFQIEVGDNYFNQYTENFIVNNYYDSNKVSNGYMSYNDYAIMSVDGNRIRIKDKDYNTLDEWITYLKGLNPKLNVQYKLNTLTRNNIILPEIKSLYLINTLEVCDSNGVCASNIEVEYDG